MKAWWRKEGNQYWVVRQDFERALAECGFPEVELRRKMGHGYHVIADLLAGGRVSQMTAVLVQGQLEPRNEKPAPPPWFPK
jgi:hypothetical protein